jgi:hypothetical protein
MASHISTHARYQLAATVLAVAGGLWCLGALMSRDGVTLLVVGMMHLATSMLIMSLRPLKGSSREALTQGERLSREGQTLDISIHRVGTDERKAGTLERDRAGSASEGTGSEGIDRAVQLTTVKGATRPQERKSRTWSI